MRYFLENSQIKVEIDSFGAEVKSVIRKDSNREYMWYGNPAIWGRTSPVLFPFVGGLEQGEYRYKGHTYKMSSHGFARDNEFKLAECGPDASPASAAGNNDGAKADNDCSAKSGNDGADAVIWFRLDSSAETLAVYPFEFKLYIGYALIGDTLKVMWKVANPSSDTMYFSIGAHPAFLCPVHGEGSKEDYRIGFYKEGAPVSEIHHYGNWKKGLVVMEDLVLPLENGLAQITPEFFDKTTYMIPNRQADTVTIEDANGTKYVEVSFDTPIFAVWSPEKKNAPFFCIEPWYGRCDESGFAGTLEERPYTNELAGGCVFEAEYKISFLQV